MKYELPTKATRETLNIDVREVEAMLQGTAIKIPPFPEAMLTLKDGRTLYIREAKMEEVPAMLEYVERLMKVEHDYYDIVGARV